MRPGSGGRAAGNQAGRARLAAGYDEHATARFAAEPAKNAGSAGRSPFQRDRARVLHSSALRRLAGKTQVVEVGRADFPRTRLTHSLECAQIGRELGASLGCDPDLVDAACLAHDLGHPPFGHNGEAALDQVAKDCGGFEGNAQSLRLLTRIEAKVPGAGLNLTRATLDATLKYPWVASAAGSPGTAVGKYGCYDEDGQVFAWIRDDAPGARAGKHRPCLEAQVMDWADDVAYSVHDLEDGLHSGLITLGRLRDEGQRREIAELARAQYCLPGSVTTEELTAVFDQLVALDWWPDRFDGGPSTAAAVKNLTSELIGRFCDAAQQATLAGGRADRGPYARYGVDLDVPWRQRLECALLKAVTAHYVMGRAGAAAAQARERQVLTELSEALAGRAPDELDPMFRAEYGAAGSDAGRLRVIVDQVASLTDTSALAWHGELCR